MRQRLVGTNKLVVDGSLEVVCDLFGWGGLNGEEHGNLLSQKSD